jgi:hypothetical protein
MRRKALAHHLLDFRLQAFGALHVGLQHDNVFDDAGTLRVWLLVTSTSKPRRPFCFQKSSQLLEFFCI